MGETLRRVAANESLAALSRIAVFLVSAMALPLGFWIISTIMALSMENAVQQATLEAQGRTLAEQAAALAETKRTRDNDRDAVLALRSDLAGLLEQVKGQSRALGRIEAYLDRNIRP
jgi:hypothetical protein